MIKRLFCRHNWRAVNPMIIGKSDYGCSKCGKVKGVWYSDYRTWRFKREMKGESFE